MAHLVVNLASALELHRLESLQLYPHQFGKMPEVLFDSHTTLLVRHVMYTAFIVDALILESITCEAKMLPIVESSHSGTNNQIVFCCSHNLFHLPNHQPLNPRKADFVENSCGNADLCCWNNFASGKIADQYALLLVLRYVYQTLLSFLPEFVSSGSKIRQSFIVS